MTWKRLVFLALISLYFVIDFVAVIFVKKWIDKGERSGLLIGMLLYSGCSACWCAGLLYEKVGRASMVYTLFAALCGVLAGFWWFKERLSTANMVGVALAFVALILLLIPGEEG